MRIWKQDPSVESIGVRTAWVHTPVAAGPSDDEITMVGSPPVVPNEADDFLLDPVTSEAAFDAVHAFTVVRQVVTMYKRALHRVTGSAEFAWQWGSGQPIEVDPNAGDDKNAYYSRNDRALKFFYFDWPVRDVVVHTARSFDIVAHEAGHAVLDSMQPGYLVSNHPQTGGLHESFGDLTAIFTLLAQLDQCEAIIAESKGDLHAKGFFAAVAEQFGEALYGHDLGLRNADNDLKLSEVTTEVHAISVVFTGAVYDILADMFDHHRADDEYDPAETLFRVGKHLTSLVVLSFLAAPATNATYADLAQIMEDAEPVAEWKPIIRSAFERREIFTPQPVAAAPSDEAPSCPTMALARSMA
jgi:hypothetical protein